MVIYLRIVKMKVNQITTNSIYSGRNLSKNKKSTFPTFKSNISEIGQIFASRNIQTNFNGNSFIAECSSKIVKLFEGFYGRSCLPKAISFEKLPEGTYGVFIPSLDVVVFNSQSSVNYVINFQMY